jgi:fibronectin type 3 domain-containing protein
LVFTKKGDKSKMNFHRLKPVIRMIFNFILVLFFGLVIFSGCTEKIKTGQPAVKNYTSKDSGTGLVKLTWKNVSGADSYNIYISKVPGAKHNGDKISAVSNPFTITDLKIGTTYYFVVTAVHNGIESDASNEVSYSIGE